MLFKLTLAKIKKITLFWMRNCITCKLLHREPSYMHSSESDLLLHSTSIFLFKLLVLKFSIKLKCVVKVGTSSACCNIFYSLLHCLEPRIIVAMKWLQIYATFNQNRIWVWKAWFWCHVTFSFILSDADVSQAEKANSGKTISAVMLWKVICV